MNNSKDNWKILIVDDEKLIHDVLTMNLRDMLYENKAVTLLNAYSASEAKQIIVNNPDIAVIILDVMMEQDNAGLNLAKFIREDLKNINVRILLHTGQPGIAPKKQVAEDYIIDAYLDKNMADNDDCYVAVKLALKSYQEFLNLRHTAKKDDIGLLEDITDNYISLLVGKDCNINYNYLLDKVGNMVNSAQEILAGYSLNDIKNDLSLGSTKKQRLSIKDYSALIRINDIRVILSHASIEEYNNEQAVNLNMLQQSATLFSEIEILPENCRQALQKRLQVVC